jgi:pilus assembly protein CpaC
VCVACKVARHRCPAGQKVRTPDRWELVYFIMGPGRYLQSCLAMMGLILFLFAFLSDPSYGRPPASATEHLLVPAESIFLPKPATGSVVVADSKIVRAKDAKGRVQLIASKPGSTHIAVGETSHIIHVMSQPDLDYHRVLQKLTKTMLGPKVTVKGGQTLITGEILRFEDIEEILAANPGGAKFQWNVRMEPEVRHEFENHVRRKLGTSGLPALPVVLSGPATAMLGIQHKDLLSQYQAVLQALGVEPMVVAKTVEIEPLIRVRILMAEVRKTAMQKLGIQWPGETRATLVPPSSIQLANAEWTVHILETKGESRVLASPTLLSRSGEEAQFLAGGEFPVRTTTMNRIDLQWKQHGIILKIKPRADHFGRMSIFVHTEVSMVDTSQSVDGVPGLLINRLQSHFDLEKSQTIALSGLIKNDWGFVRSGLPGLVRIPILGKLFGSEEYRNNKTELVVFVTPEIARENDPPQNHIPQGLKDDIQL